MATATFISNWCRKFPLNDKLVSAIEGSIRNDNINTFLIEFRDAFTGHAKNIIMDLREEMPIKIIYVKYGMRIKTPVLDRFLEENFDKVVEKEAESKYDYGLKYFIDNSDIIFMYKPAKRILNYALKSGKKLIFIE